jgi:hypothetical protein
MPGLSSRLSLLDWSIVLLYLLGMLAIGPRIGTGPGFLSLFSDG